MQTFNQLFINTLVAGLPLALFAASFGIIYSTARFFHFAHGAVYTVGAYGAYTLTIAIGMSPALGLAGGVVAAAITGVLMAAGVYIPLRRAAATPLVLFLVSLGFLVMLQNMLSLIYGDQTYGLWRGVPAPGLSLLGARATTIQLMSALLSLFLLGGAWLALTFLRYGKILRAVANDPELSWSVGVSPEKVMLVAFAVSSALAGLAGILAGYDSGLTPVMGFHALLMGVVAAIIGGMGSIPGALAGSILIAGARNLGVFWFPSQWQDAIVFVILILFLLFRPQGFLGKPLRKAAV